MESTEDGPSANRPAVARCRGRSLLPAGLAHGADDRSEGGRLVVRPDVAARELDELGAQPLCNDPAGAVEEEAAGLRAAPEHEAHAVAGDQVEVGQVADEGP